VVTALDAPTADFLADAMAAGARGAVGLPLRLDELAERLASAADLAPPSDAEARVDGKVIAIAGAKGGVGATTVAVQLALRLARNEGRVCLADFDLQTGTVGLALGIRHPRGLSDLVTVDDLSKRVVSDTLYPHPSGLRVLLAPHRGEYAECVGEHTARRLIAILQSLFSVVVVDVGSQLSLASFEAVSRADEVVLVTTPDVLSLRCAERAARLWARGDARAERDVRVLLNRVARQDQVTARLARETLGELTPLETMIPAAFRALESAVNQLDPRRVTDRGLQAQYGRLADELSLLTRPPIPVEALPRLAADGGNGIGAAGGTGGVGGIARERGAGHRASPRARGGVPGRRRDAGQAALEFVGVLPVLIAAGLFVLQLLLSGVTWTLTGFALDSASRQLQVADPLYDPPEVRAADRSALEAAARGALPPAWASGAQIIVTPDPARGRERVTVLLRTPQILPGLRRFRVSASADVPDAGAPAGGTDE